MARQLYCIDPSEALTTGTYQGDEGKLKIFLELSDTLADLYDPLPDGLTAEALLLDVPTVHSDDSFFRASADVAVGLDNTEGVFTPMDLVGWYAQIWGFSCNDEKRLVFSGQVVSQQNELEETRLSLRDLPIGSLDTVLPQRTIEEGDFPTSQSQGSEIPIVFGRAIRHRCPNLSTGYQTALTDAVDNDPVTPITYGMREEVDGIAFTPGTRVLGGTPTAAGFYTASYTLTDAVGKFLEKEFLIEIRAEVIPNIFVIGEPEHTTGEWLWKFQIEDVINSALPPNLSRPDGITEYNGDLLVFSSSAIAPSLASLWLINPSDPNDRRGSYGRIGVLPLSISHHSQAGLTVHNGDVYLLIYNQQTSVRRNELWRINPDDPSDTSGDYGMVGTLPLAQGLVASSLVSHDGGLYTVASGRRFWRINPDNPSDESGVYGLVGSTPSGAAGTQGLTSLSGGLYAIVDTASVAELWRINPADPDDTSGVYGYLGDLPSGVDDVESPRGIAGLSGDLYVTNLLSNDSFDNNLWRINPADPDDTSGDYGEVGALVFQITDGIYAMTSHNGDLYIEDRIADVLWRRVDNSGWEFLGALPSAVTLGTAMTSHGGHLYLISNRGLWRINPDNPSDESGVYGYLGDLPSGVTTPNGMTSHEGFLYVADNAGNELWRINPSDPDDTSGDYGLVGTLPSGLTGPNAMASHGGFLYVADDAGNELWRINHNDPDDETGDYGLVKEILIIEPTAMTSHNGKLLIIDRSNIDRTVGNISFNNGIWPFDPDDPYPYELPFDNHIGMASDSNGDLLVITTNREFWRINPADPSDTSGDYGMVGTLPSTLTSPEAMTLHSGNLYVSNSNGLWRINPADPDDTSGVYGLVGAFPSGLTDPEGMASFENQLYVFHRSGRQLWRINPDNPDDTSGVYGMVYTFPNAFQFDGMTSDDLGLMAVDSSSSIPGLIWRINPDRPSLASGGYGPIGYLPSALRGAEAIASNLAEFSHNFTTIDDIRRVVGAVGRELDITFPEIDAGRKLKTLKIRVDSLRGIAEGDSIQVGTGTAEVEDAVVSEVNVVDSGGNLLPPSHADYHTVELVGGLANDHASGAAVVNFATVYDYLLGEGETSTGHFMGVSRVYHDGRALPEIEHDLSAVTALEMGEVRVILPDRLRVNVSGWYRGFTVEFLEGLNLRRELIVEDYNSVTNSITVTNPGAINYDRIRLNEYRFFNGSQTHPYPGLAFIRIAKPYTQEITADVSGFAITDPREVINRLLRNTTWGAGEREVFITEGADLSVYKFEGSIRRGNLRGIIEEVSLFRHFKLFRKKDGIHFRAFESESNPPSLPPNREDYVQVPSLSRASLTERVTRLNLSYRPDGRARELTQSLSEDQGLGDLGGEREIETPYIYEGVTADRVLWYQHQIELAARRTLECSIDVCSLEGDSLQVGKVLRLPADLIENTASNWLIAGMRERVDLTVILSLLEYNSDLYDYPTGRVISVSDTYDPETDFSETPSEPVRDLDITAVVCETLLEDNSTVEENCVELTFETPDENYAGAEIEYQTSTGAIVLVGRVDRDEKKFAFTVPERGIIYRVFVYPLSPNNDLRGYPALATADFEDATPLALPPGLAVTGGEISSIPFVRVAITADYTPPMEFLEIRVEADFRAGDLVYEVVSERITAGNIADLWENDGLTLRADPSNIPAGDRTALVTVGIFSADGVGTSRQFTVDT